MIRTKCTDLLVNRKGKGLPAGEENLRSDAQFVINFFKFHKQLANAGEESAEVQDMLQRASRHSANIVNAMKAYSWVE